MSASFHLVLRCPDGVVFEDDVESLIAPGEAGYFGVLAGHAAMIAGLAAGKITIRRPDSFDPEIFISKSSGFFEVAKNKAVLLFAGDVSSVTKA